MSAEIFEFFLRLRIKDDVISVPFQFPEKITDRTVIQSVPKFCFPEGAAIEKDVEKDKTESFSFVSTLNDGNKRYGYCRRFFRVGQPPECYCLLSFSASFSLFSQLLDIVELKFAESDKSVYTFLHSVLAQPFPDPGRTIEAQTFQTVMKVDGKEDYIPETFRLTRSNDDYEYLEYTSYDGLFRAVDVEKILLIFECLLNERRILLVAKTLGTLTSCMDAVANMAYPFSWQYVFIPILPTNMLSFVSAPMPFLMGILSTCLERALEEPMEEGVLIVDIDNNEILNAPEDLPPIMPNTATEKLAKSLKAAVASGKRHMEFSINVAHAFLKFWASLFGTYSKYFEPINQPEPTSAPNTISQDSDTTPAPTAGASSTATGAASPRKVVPHVFNFERFIKSKPSEVKKFLIAFKEYQLYQYFIQEREQWLQKGLLGYCIILRAQNAKKKDSMAAVTAKLKTGVGRWFAAWNESAAAWNENTAPPQKKQRAVTVAHSSSTAPNSKRLLIEAPPASTGAVGSVDDTATDSESIEQPSPLQSDMTESEDGSSSGSGKRKNSAGASAQAAAERPRAATDAPPVPPKPRTNRWSKIFSFSTTIDSTKPQQADPPPAATAAPSASSSAPRLTTPFTSRFSFKPSPLLDGTYEKQIWKLCNVEALSDKRILSNEMRKYWLYSPVLFQRLPQLEAIPLVDDCIPLDLGDEAMESLLQWVYSDDIELESAESALELLAFFSASDAQGSTSILRHKIATQVVKKMCNDNVLRYLKVFSKAAEGGSSASTPRTAEALTRDTLIATILDAAKLHIANFSAEEMTPIFRRQLGAVSHVTLASILHLKSSASSRNDLKDSINSVLETLPSAALGDSTSPRRGGGTSPRSSHDPPQKHLVRDMARLFESGKHTDVTLLFSLKSPNARGPQEETQIAVHSKILAARSPHLNKILGLNISDQVSILNVSAAHFKKLLPYIYTGQMSDVKDDREAVLELVQAAHLLDLDTSAFRDALYASLATKFTPSSAIEFLETPIQQEGSMQHPAERAVLVGAASYFLARHPTVFYRPEKLKSLDPDVWECIFKYAYATPNPTPPPSSPSTKPTSEKPKSSTRSKRK